MLHRICYRYTSGHFVKEVFLIIYSCVNVPPSSQVTDKDTERLSAFFSRNTYISGKYADEDSFSKLDTHIQSLPGGTEANRLFYLALPPTVYHDVSKNIRTCCMSTKSVHFSCQLLLCHTVNSFHRSMQSPKPSPFVMSVKVVLLHLRFPSNKM